MDGLNAHFFSLDEGFVFDEAGQVVPR